MLTNSLNASRRSRTCGEPVSELGLFFTRSMLCSYSATMLLHGTTELRRRQGESAWGGATSKIKRILRFGTGDHHPNNRAYVPACLFKSTVNFAPPCFVRSRQSLLQQYLVSANSRHTPENDTAPSIRLSYVHSICNVRKTPPKPPHTSR